MGKGGGRVNLVMDGFFLNTYYVPHLYLSGAYKCLVRPILQYISLSGWLNRYILKLDSKGTRALCKILCVIHESNSNLKIAAVSVTLQKARVKTEIKVLHGVRVGSSCARRTPVYV